MVREELGAVVATTRELLDPGRGLLVPRRALTTRELSIRNLLREGVREHEFDFARDRGTPVTPEELRTLELVKRFLRLPLRTLPERAHAAQPARSPEHGRILDELLGARACPSRAATMPCTLSGNPFASPARCQPPDSRTSSPCSCSMRTYSCA